MSEHTYFYQGVRSMTEWSATEPECKKDAHCWHSHWRASMNSLSGEVPRAKSICCYCAALREQRPNLDAHGPHHPDRQREGARAYWSHESGGQLATVE